MELKLISEKEIVGYLIKKYTYKSFDISVETDQKNGITIICCEDSEKLFSITSIHDNIPILSIGPVALCKRTEVDMYKERLSDAALLLEYISEHRDELTK